MLTTRGWPLQPRSPSGGKAAKAKPMSDSYLLDAGWLFFAAWSLVVIVVSVKAFGSDLFPKLFPSPSPNQDHRDPAPTRSRANSSLASKSEIR
jgi:hypothetical protein